MGHMLLGEAKYVSIGSSDVIHCTRVYRNALYPHRTPIYPWLQPNDTENHVKAVIRTPYPLYAMAYHAKPVASRPNANNAVLIFNLSNPFTSATPYTPKPEHSPSFPCPSDDHPSPTNPVDPAQAAPCASDLPVPSPSTRAL